MDCSAIAVFLNKQLVGSNIEIVKFSTLAELKNNCFVFCKKYSVDFERVLNEHKMVLAIVTSEYEGRIDCSYIVSENPRLDYLRVIKEFFVERANQVDVIHPTAVIEDGAKLGENVYIGANCYIGKNVIIGDRTYINPNVIIVGDTMIGHDCFIKSGVVIGQSGFGFEMNENGIPEHFPHVGKIEIGNNVYIGANTAIDRGTLGSTIIHDNVKIDNLVHIAHNDVIGENSFVIAGAILGGGVEIGENCWIAPNVSIKQQSRVGDNALVGLGAVVLKNVDSNTVVVGNPAKVLKK